MLLYNSKYFESADFILYLGIAGYILYSYSYSWQSSFRSWKILFFACSLSVSLNCRDGKGLKSSPLQHCWSRPPTGCWWTLSHLARTGVCQEGWHCFVSHRLGITLGGIWWKMVLRSTSDGDWLHSFVESSPVLKNHVEIQPPLFFIWVHYFLSNTNSMWKRVKKELSTFRKYLMYLKTTLIMYLDVSCFAQPTSFIISSHWVFLTSNHSCCPPRDLSFFFFFFLILLYFRDLTV